MKLHGEGRGPHVGEPRPERRPQRHQARALLPLHQLRNHDIYSD